MSIVTSTTRQPFTHTVEVGKAGYTFSPDTLLAEVGDYITYAFYPRNHSVIRSDYGYPCIPYGLVNTRPGFYSPFMPVDAILETPPTFTVRVNDTEPIFVYCSGPVACNEYGMVAVVNPTANTSLEVHRQKAKKASYVLQPGDKWPDEEPKPNEISSSHSSTSTSTGSSTAAPSTVTVTPTPTTTAANSASTAITSSSSSRSGLSPGEIAGIIIGAAAIALIAAIALYICGRKSRRGDFGNGSFTFGRNKNDPRQGGTGTPGTVPPPSYFGHGAPTMTQGPNKAFAGPSIVEHYNLGGAPQQMDLHYAHQNVPPHILDPAAFSHNPNYINVAAPLHSNPPYQQQQQYYTHHSRDGIMHRPEIYSGTPALVPQPMSQLNVAGAVTSRNGNSIGTSVGGQTQSRGGSPDILHEMNAVRSQAGDVMPEQQGSVR